MVYANLDHIALLFTQSQLHKPDEGLLCWTLSIDIIPLVSMFSDRLSLFIGSYEGQVYAVNSLVKDTDLQLEVPPAHMHVSPQDGMRHCNFVHVPTYVVPFPGTASSGGSQVRQ